MRKCPHQAQKRLPIFLSSARIENSTASTRKLHKITFLSFHPEVAITLVYRYFSISDKQMSWEKGSWCLVSKTSGYCWRTRDISFYCSNYELWVGAMRLSSID
jgi:hypothetical protein